MTNPLGAWTIVPMATGALIAQYITYYKTQQASLKKRASDLEKSITLFKIRSCTLASKSQVRNLPKLLFLAFLLGSERKTLKIVAPWLT